jgi:hypothetical protein
MMAGRVELRGRLGALVDAAVTPVPDEAHHQLCALRSVGLLLPREQQQQLDEVRLRHNTSKE